MTKLNLFTLTMSPNLSEDRINWFGDAALCSFIAMEAKVATVDNLIVLYRTVFFINEICRRMIDASSTLGERYQLYIDNWKEDLADIHTRSGMSGKLIPSTQQIARLRLLYPKLISLLEVIPTGAAEQAWIDAIRWTKKSCGRSN